MKYRVQITKTDGYVINYGIKVWPKGSPEAYQKSYAMTKLGAKWEARKLARSMESPKKPFIKAYELEI